MLMLLPEITSIRCLSKHLRQVMACPWWIYCHALTGNHLEKTKCNWSFWVDRLFFFFPDHDNAVKTLWIRLVRFIPRMQCINRKVLSRSCSKPEASSFPLIPIKLQGCVSPSGKCGTVGLVVVLLPKDFFLFI